MLENRNLTGEFVLRTLIEDFHITLKKHDKLAIIGEENEKSILLKVIYDQSSVTYCMLHSEKLLRREIRLDI